jgi:2-hydroxyacyl-CoA lyase 1
MGGLGYGGRYKLPVVIIVLNNNGIYGGDRRPAPLQQAAAAGASHGGFSADPVPTAFVHDAR